MTPHGKLTFQSELYIHTYTHYKAESRYVQATIYILQHHGRELGWTA